jgi:hypothetical protein
LVKVNYISPYFEETVHFFIKYAIRPFIRS